MLKIIFTKDGSPTLLNEQKNITYHSKDGAFGESRYVFLEKGELFELLSQRQEVHVLEIGTGTGTNLFLSMQAAANYPDCQFHYYGYEPYPLSTEILSEFHLHSGFPAEWVQKLADFQPVWHFGNCFVNLFQECWKPETITPAAIDLLYLDAFAPQDEPSLWTEAALAGMMNTLAPGGILVTYSITGNTKRILKSAGFKPEICKGFGKKREMLKVRKSM